VREPLRSQDTTEWVIFSTGMFISYLFELAFGVVDLENSESHALGSLDTAVTLNETEKMVRRLSLSDVTVKAAYRLTRVLSYG
jgi:hypothetical protein